MVLVEVAAQDPGAPSWKFLQRCWGELQAAGAGEASAQEGAMLLWVISHAASRFPAADAANLTSGLLQVSYEAGYKQCAHVWVVVYLP